MDSSKLFNYWANMCQSGQGTMVVDTWFRVYLTFFLKKIYTCMFCFYVSFVMGIEGGVTNDIARNAHIIVPTYLRNSQK
jgi:hypothetical protein